MVVLAYSALIACFASWCFRNGYILYYGDAQSHLNISRSIIDSRTPGYDRLGTVWLPVLHLICLPFVRNNFLWTTGLAGTLPVALCFLAAGFFLYMTARQAYASASAALVVAACFALNPNILYLASVPMTEIVFTAELMMLLFALLQFRVTQQRRWMCLGVFVSWCMSLTRYDGWFLIPFAAIAFALFARRNRWSVLVTFGALASLAPVYWLAHNWWETANSLDFYNGPYSAIAIQSDRPYPGFHDWPAAAGYYAAGAELCTGWGLTVLGAVGFVFAILIWVGRIRTATKNLIGPLLSFLLLTPAFYIWSIHSSRTPMFVPLLPPYTYYNSRYGIAVVVLAAFAAGAIVISLPGKWKKCAILLPLISIAPWLLPASKERWICWKESQVNSVARRAWTASAADFLAAHYHSGEGILTESGTGDVSGVFCRARIPLREALFIGNDPAWYANAWRPDLIHQEIWVVAQAGDRIARSIERNKDAAYELREDIRVPKAPPLYVFHRFDPKLTK